MSKWVEDQRASSLRFRIVISISKLTSKIKRSKQDWKQTDQLNKGINRKHRIEIDTIIHYKQAKRLILWIHLQTTDRR